MMRSLLLIATALIALLFSSSRLDSLLSLNQGTFAGIIGIAILLFGFVAAMMSMFVRWQKRQQMYDVSPGAGGEVGAEVSSDVGGFDFGGGDCGGGGDG